MECSEVRLNLDEYLAGRLDAVSSGIVASHVEECRDCREELGILREINDMLCMETPAFAGPNFTSEVMKKIQYEKARERKFFLRLPVLNLGASLVLAGLMTIFISMPTVNGAITRYASNLAYNAQSISSSLNAATGNVNSYIRNILSTGGK